MEALFYYWLWCFRSCLTRLRVQVEVLYTLRHKISPIFVWFYYKLVPATFFFSVTAAELFSPLAVFNYLKEAQICLFWMSMSSWVSFIALFSPSHGHIMILPGFSFKFFSLCGDFPLKTAVRQMFIPLDFRDLVWVLHFHRNVKDKNLFLGGGVILCIYRLSRHIWGFVPYSLPSACTS